MVLHTDTTIIQKDDKLENNTEKKDKSTSNKKSEELGGYKGQEPTTYGDWQHKGRVTDF